MPGPTNTHSRTAARTVDHIASLGRAGQQEQAISGHGGVVNQMVATG